MGAHSIVGPPPRASIYSPEREARQREACRWGAVTANRLDYAEQPDERLVELLEQQDVRALETLYGRYAGAVYSMALKMLSEPSTAEEVVQECFLKLWRQPRLFQPERGRLVSWLLGVSHHRSVDQLRRRRLEQRYTAGEAGDSLAGDGDPEQLAWDNARVEALGRALASLPPNQRLALELAYLRGMTQAEIAASLGEPLGTIKTRTRLAMQKLRASPELTELVSDAG